MVTSSTREMPRRPHGFAQTVAPPAAANGSDASDAELMDAVRAGDVDAYARLVGRYRDTYARFATRMLGDATVAAEALHSTFVRAHGTIDQCDDPECFGSWLYQIVIQECLEIERRRGATSRTSIIGGDAEAFMQYAISTLPTEQRELFVLRYVEELSYDEMSRLTGLDGATIRRRVYAACRVLRQMLPEDAGE
jgi:RNA polymerase sigma-70 factor (ECF subfamily)